MKLSEVALDFEVRVERFDGRSDIAAVLRAVGISEGSKVKVVRRAPFGGPLFLRASSGAEVAIDPEIARIVEVM